MTRSKALVVLGLVLVFTAGLAGQAPTNSVSTNNLNFVSYVGGPNPASQPVTISTLPATPNWTVTTDGSLWLSVSATSGSGTSTIQASVTTGSLAAGYYNGKFTIQIVGSPDPYIVNVYFIVAPTLLSFSGNVGGSNPASQTLQLTIAASSSQALNWSASVSTSTGGSWLSVTPTSAASPGGSTQTLTVSVNTAGLAVGTYQGTITVGNATIAGITNLTVQPVTLTISTPAVTLAPTSLTFNGTAGGSAPPGQTVAVTTAGGWASSVSVTGNVNWLSVTPTSGSGNGSFTVNVDVSKLSAGTFNGTVAIAPATGTPVTLPVTLTVTAPAVSVAPTSLTFNGSLSGSAPQPQTVAVTATAGWSGSVTTTSGGSWLSITPTSGTGNGTFSVSVDTSKLSASSYTGTITVSPSGTGAPVTINVTVNLAGPTISVTPTTLSFTQVEGQVAQAQTVSLAATPAITTWSASATVTATTTQWLSVSPSAGGFPQAPSIGPNALAANLVAGQYQGTVTFTDSNASPTSLKVQVTLTVTAAPAAQLTVSQSSLMVQGTQANGASPVTVLIGNSGSGSLSWSAQAAVANTTVGNWLSLSTQSGSASLHMPSPVVVTFASNLPPNVYTGTITVTAGTQKQVISVTYVVMPSAPQLVLGASSLRFNMTAGGSAPAAQSVYVANSGAAAMLFTPSVVSGTIVGALPTVATTVTPGGSTTLSVGLASSTASLGAGTYYGLIAVSYASTSSPTTPAGVSYITVVLVVSGSTAQAMVTSYPRAVFLTPQQLSQPVSVSTTSKTAVPLVLVTSTNSGGNWLAASATPSSLNPSATVTISAVSASLPTTPGVYAGVVTELFGDGTAPQDTTVFLVIPKTSGAFAQSVRAAGASCTPTQLYVALRQLGPNFSATAGLPQNIEAQVFDDCANTPSGAAVVAAFSTGDAALPLASLGSGVYGATWNPVNANPVTVTITATLSPIAAATTTVAGTVAANATPPPSISAAGVVNGASFTSNGVIAPGTIISVFGSNLAVGNNPNGGFPLLSTLGGIKLSIGGIDMPLFFAGNGQVNAQVPTELAVNTQTALVARSFVGTTEVGDSVPVVVTVAPTAPGIFSANSSGQGQGAIQIANVTPPTFAAPSGSIPGSAARPAAKGEYLTIYCAGLGDVSPRPATGSAAGSNPTSTTVQKVTVTLGGAAVPATQFDFAGLAPGFVGLYQVNVQVPTSAPSGNAVPLFLTVGGVQSNTVTIAIQ
jgi:uncharacterized protein (TIGR03437 family)